MSVWLHNNPALVTISTIAALVVAAWLLGAWLAKAVRMPDYGWKFGIIFFAVFSGVTAIYLNWPPKLGIDLGGGAILVYRVDPTATEWRPEKLDSLVRAITDRVNPGGQKEISVRSLGDNMVQIIMPAISGATAKDKQAQMDEIKRIISKTGAMEFRIVATRRFQQDIIEKAAAARKAGWERAPGPNNNDGRVYPDPRTGKKEIAEWCRVRDNAREIASIRRDASLIPATIELSDGKDEKGNEKSHLEVLVLAPESSSQDVTGKDLRNAQAQLDQQRGGYEVAFRFSADGGQRFGNLTESHMPLDGGAFKYNLAIVLDHVLQSAPTINDKITDNGVIEGDFDEAEAQDLADIINRGSLPAALDPRPEREMITEATLGKDTIRQSLYAMIAAAIAVPLFMLYYYRFAGLVAVMVLSLTVLLLVAIMVLVKAPFTLTALAGLALAVGMEVDNNVLIYERLREELAHGAALRMGLRNAFHRVGVVIVDANITHVLAAAVLFYVGTEQVKGFAITFLLGALLSIWATMFVARTIFEVCERRRWLQKINMVHWIGHTKIDFMHWFPACATFSVLITVLGLVIAVVRGKGLFDIDFTGGISVQTVFRQDANMDAEKIRAAIAKYEKELPDATVTNVQSQNEAANRRFVIDTSNTNGNDVKDLIAKLFGDKLVTANVAYEIAKAPAQSSPGGAPAAPESPGMKSAAPAIHSAGPKPSDLPVDASAPKPESKPAGTARPRAPPAPLPTAAPPTAPKPTGKTVGWTSGSVRNGQGRVGRGCDGLVGLRKPPGSQPKAHHIPGLLVPPYEPADLPDASLVAMNGPEAFLIAQAAVPKPDAKPEAAKGTQTGGKLEFRIVATRRFDQSLIQAAAAARKAAWEKDPGPNNNDGRVYPDPKTGKKEIAEWCRVRDKPDEIANIRHDASLIPATIELSDGKDEKGNEKPHLEVLVLAPESPNQNVTGKDLRNAQAQLDQEHGGYEVSFRFSADGGQRFGNLTGSHIPLDGGAFRYSLAIVLDHVLMCAPTINDRITDSGRIAGGFDEAEAQEIADAINRASHAPAKSEAPPRENRPKAPTGAPKPVGKTVGLSCADLPPASLVAMNGSEAFLIAQATAPKSTAAKTAAATAPKAEAKSEPKAAEKPPAKPASKTAEKPAAKPAAQPLEKPSPPPAAPVAATETPASAAVPAKPIQATLSFNVGEKIGGEEVQKPRFEQEQLRSMIEQALEENKIPSKSIVVDLANAAGSDVSDEWKVTFTPKANSHLTLTSDSVNAVLKTLKSNVAKQPYFPGVDNMGSAVAGDTRFWACVALVLSWSLIIIYLWIRFQGVAFGLAAVIALIHDVLVMLGGIAFSSYLALIPGVTAVTLIEPFKINLTIVAAFLTIIGYSVNDTIVVFDRIREIRGKSPTLTRQMVNDATNQTLSRTLLTSLTVLMVVFILYVAGGQAMHGFAFALFIGVLTGTYSSIYVAAPILLWVLHPKEMQASTATGATPVTTR